MTVTRCARRSLSFADHAPRDVFTRLTSRPRRTVTLPGPDAVPLTVSVRPRRVALVIFTTLAGRMHRLGAATTGDTAGARDRRA